MKVPCQWSVFLLPTKWAIEICGFQKVQGYHSKQFCVGCSFDAIKKKNQQAHALSSALSWKALVNVDFASMTAGDCKFECALGQVVPAPTLLSGLCASAARVPKSQNWCQMCVNIKNPLQTFLFPQSLLHSPDTNARRTLRPQGQPLLTPAGGHLWDLQQVVLSLKILLIDELFDVLC